jgi:hypothetical protein
MRGNFPRVRARAHEDRYAVRATSFREQRGDGVGAGAHARHRVVPIPTGSDDSTLAHGSRADPELLREDRCQIPHTRVRRSEPKHDSGLR